MKPQPDALALFIKCHRSHKMGVENELKVSAVTFRWYFLTSLQLVAQLSMVSNSLRRNL